MIADLVRQVGGDKTLVETIMGPGVDPHLYKPAPRDLSILIAADIIFANGLHLEGRMIDILERYSRKKPVLFVSERIDSKLLRSSQDFPGGHDPHLWMDVSLWRKVVDTVADGLVEFDPRNTAFYRTNQQILGQRLEALDSRAKEMIGSIPQDARVLITAHDAFYYFGRAYNIEVRGIQGISTDSEAGLRDINSLVDLIVQRKIPAVFFESSVSQKNVLALIEGAQSRGHSVSVGGELYSDSMGSPETREGNYIGMIEHNLRVIASGLGGAASKDKR